MKRNNIDSMIDNISQSFTLKYILYERDIKAIPFSSRNGIAADSVAVVRLVISTFRMCLKLTTSRKSCHRRAVAQHCINGDSTSQWRMAKFDPT